MFDDSTRGGQHWEPAIADKDSHALGCTAHRSVNDPMMFENVHRAFYKQRDHLVI
ncbi:hypothetical protein D3C71_2127750 [compost metagenome]